jgi:pyrimidine oxygenase
MGALQGRDRPRGDRLPRHASGGSFERAPSSQPLQRKTLGVDKLPINQRVLVGSYGGGASARLDGIGAGARGVILTFDDFRIGMGQFGQRIQPLMKSRVTALVA